MRLVLALLLSIVASLSAFLLDGPRPFGRIAVTAGLPSIGVVLLDDPMSRGTALYRSGRFAEAAETLRAAGPRAAYNRGNALARAGRFVDAIHAYDAAIEYFPRDDDARANRALVAALVARENREDPIGSDLANASASNEKQQREGEERSASEGEESQSTGDGMAGDRDTGTASAAPGGSRASRRGRAEQATTASGEGQAQGSATDSEGAGRTGGGAAALATAFEQAAERQSVNKRYELRSVVASRQWLATLADEPGRYLKLRLAAEHERRVELGIAVPPGDDPW